MSRFTPEQIKVAQYAVRQYNNRIEMIWDDTMWDVGMTLGLEDEDVSELMDEVM